jgi:hypothetical protein
MRGKVALFFRSNLDFFPRRPRRPLLQGVQCIGIGSGGGATRKKGSFGSALHRTSTAFATFTTQTPSLPPPAHTLIWGDRGRALRCASVLRPGIPRHALWLVAGDSARGAVGGGRWPAGGGGGGGGRLAAGRWPVRGRGRRVAVAVAVAVAGGGGGGPAGRTGDRSCR